MIIRPIEPAIGVHVLTRRGELERGQIIAAGELQRFQSHLGGINRAAENDRAIRRCRARDGGRNLADDNTDIFPIHFIEHIRPIGGDIAGGDGELVAGELGRAADLLSFERPE